MSVNLIGGCRDQDGDYAIWQSKKGENPQCGRGVIEMNNDFDQSRHTYFEPRDQFDGEEAQPLIAAVEAGDLATVAKLLKAGESPNASDEDGNGLLHLAVQAGQGAGRIGELLTEYGIDVNAKNDWGDAPLHVAVWPEEYFEPDAETVSALLALRGLRINEPNAQGRTALSLAIEGGEFGDQVNEAIIGLLLSHGADPSIPDRAGRTALDWSNGIAGGTIEQRSPKDSGGISR